MFGRLGHVVRCLHPVVGGAVCCYMLYDVVFVGTHVFATTPREGGDRKHLIFLF